MHCHGHYERNTPRGEAMAFALGPLFTPPLAFIVQSATESPSLEASTGMTYNHTRGGEL
jgi:hypothetical protein